MQNQRYNKAIERNLAELQRAILIRTTLLGFERESGVTSLFLKMSYFALFNDYIAHCIKVFEQSKQSASFWYIYRTNQPPINEYTSKKNIDISELEDISNRLKRIRDQTHFHIDSTGVLDTHEVWRVAGLTGKRLSDGVNAVWSILDHLQKSLSLPEVALPCTYNEAHVHERVVAIENGKFNT